ncbi:pseudaminic acid synthase [bacterium]
MFIIKNDNIVLGDKVFVVAELSANHRHDFSLAVDSIKAIKEAGADAVKLQTYTPDTITIDCDNEYFKIKHGTMWDGLTLYNLYKEAYTPWEWHADLKKIAEDIGLIFFSTPFDKTAVDFLEELNVPLYKIASFEITDIPLIKYTAAKGKPVIISTGIADINNIEDAVNACRSEKNNNIILTKCTSAYPAPLREMNLKTIPELEKKFSTVVGISDHSTSLSVPIAAAALGAKIIEKHFILNRKLGGPDAAFSLEPEEFKTMVNSVREVEQALGKVNYELTDKTKKNKMFARSLFIVKDVKKGDVLTSLNVRSIRPSNGMSPKYLEHILGRKVKSDYSKGTPLNMDMIGD